MKYFLFSLLPSFIFFSCMPLIDPNSASNFDTTDQQIQQEADINTNNELVEFIDTTLIPESSILDSSLISLDTITSEELPSINNEVLLEKLITLFDSCSYYGNAMLITQGLERERLKNSGNVHYNDATNQFIKLQQGDLSNERRKIISEALSFYAEIFNNIEIGGGFASDLSYHYMQVHSLLSSTQVIKKDDRFIINLDYLYTKEVRLPGNGNWCLWQMIGGQRIWMQGTLIGQGGFGKFDIRAENLPVYLGKEKYFTITNASEFNQSIQLIFQPCERD